MHYICGYEPKGGRENLSIILRHGDCRNGQVCFACLGIAGEATNLCMERLLSWFTVFSMKKSMRNCRRELRRVLAKVFAELENEGEVDLAGVLCIGRQAILFQNGSVVPMMISESYGRTCAQLLNVRGVESVLLETGVGIVLATETFAKTILEMKLGQCLHMRTITCEEQMNRHLKEVGEAVSKESVEDWGVIAVNVQDRKQRGARNAAK